MGFLTVIWTMSGYDTPFHLSEECSNANIAGVSANRHRSLICGELNKLTATCHRHDGSARALLGLRYHPRHCIHRQGRRGRSGRLVRPTHGQSMRASFRQKGWSWSVSDRTQISVARTDGNQACSQSTSSLSSSSAKVAPSRRRASSSHTAATEQFLVVDGGARSTLGRRLPSTACGLF